MQRQEEEPYTCARSCGCPTPFFWRETTLQSVVHWITSNRAEWLAGITTGLTAVPTAVAFAILAGVAPSVGLRGTWIIMLVMALFGGEAVNVGLSCISVRRRGDTKVVVLQCVVSYEYPTSDGPVISTQSSLLPLFGLYVFRDDFPRKGQERP